MDGSQTCFLSVKEVRISKVVKPKQKHTAPLQNENIFLHKVDYKRETEMNKNAVADEGGVITERMNKRKRRNTKEETE